MVLLRSVDLDVIISDRCSMLRIISFPANTLFHADCTSIPYTTFDAAQGGRGRSVAWHAEETSVGSTDKARLESDSESIV